MGGISIGALFIWAMACAHRAVVAERAAAAAAHDSSVRLVRLAMELQAELDAQEDHDRWTLQLYLRLERESIPELHREITAGVSSCPSAAQQHTEKALAAFGEDAHRHSHAMLQALQRQGARNRKRSAELASGVLAQARADRERVRTSGQGPAAAGWSDADLEGPLVALSRALRRPNATFELPLQTLQQWEATAAEALREGGAASSALVDRLHHLVVEAPLPQNDRMRNELLSAGGDPAQSFISLLQRGRHTAALAHANPPELERTRASPSTHPLTKPASILAGWVGQRACIATCPPSSRR